MHCTAGLSCDWMQRVLMQVTHGLQVQANEDAIIVTVEWAVGEFHIIHESGLSQLNVLTVHCNAQLFPHHYSLSAHLFLDDCPLWLQVYEWLHMVSLSLFCVCVCVYRWSMIYVWGCVQNPQHLPLGMGIILIISVNVDIRSTSEWTFRLVL